jgi:rhodanese-related sulfurtransferase
MVCFLLSQITLDSIKTLSSSGYRVLFVDVRSEGFFKNYPIVKGAINIPFDLLIEGYMPPKGYDLYVTVCWCPRGGIGKRAAEILRERGFNAVWLKRDGKEFEDQEDKVSGK